MTDLTRDNYHAYMLRLWRADENGKWHATLQDPHTGQLLRFDSVESVFVYLQTTLGETVSQEPSVPWLPSEPTPLSDPPVLNV
jgi:hypothetical protein